MTFEQYWTALRKHWLLVVLCFLAVGAGAAIGSKLMTPVYQSTVLMQVAIRSQNGQADYTNLLASDQLIQTEATLATSDPVLREVASRYPGLSLEQLTREVTASAKVDTQLFGIDVQDPSPIRAAALANNIATTLEHQQVGVAQQNFLLVAQPARPALRPVKPNIVLNIGAGLGIGLLLGVLLAILYERLDIRVRTIEDITQLLGWPVLATIWRARSSKKKHVFDPTGYGADVESYRLLRTNIGFSGVDKPLQSLMITSAVPQEGKSVVAANLAIFMAKAGKTTLLVDANLRRPAQREFFDLSENTTGLSDAVMAYSRSISTSAALLHHQLFSAHQQLDKTPAVRANSSTPADISLGAFVHSSNMPNLWVMPSGSLPPNPPELLESKAMQRLLSDITESGVEIVIFDTPPLLGLSDAVTLASKVDGVLVVVDITCANKKHLEKTKMLLARSGVHVLGFAVNKHPRNRKDTAYYSQVDKKKSKKRNSHLKNSSTPAQSAIDFFDPDATVRLDSINKQVLERYESRYGSGKVEHSNGHNTGEKEDHVC